MSKTLVFGIGLLAAAALAVGAAAITSNASSVSALPVVSTPSPVQIAQDPATQAPMDMEHDSAPDVQIEGAKNPDAITDRMAYRMFLQTFATTDQSSLDAQNLQAFALATALLSTDDMTIVQRIFSDFRQQYDRQFKVYKNLTDQGIQNDDAYRLNRNQLVTTTIVRLNAELSSEGFGKLNKMIQGEKSKMTISLVEEGQ